MSAQHNVNFTSTRDLTYYASQYWREVGDRRTSDLPLIREGPWPLVAILALYLIFVTKVGSKWMENRNAYQIRALMLIYNTFMVIINLHFFFESLRWLDYGRQLFNFKWPDGRDTSAKTMANIWSFYLYFLTKFIDLFDTVFFVLRKKSNQITILHLYHHISVPIIGWISVLLCPVMPVLGLFSLLNSFCHVLMYSYYALSTFGSFIQKYLWWKKYITQIQLIQFLIIGCYGVVLNLRQTNYPISYCVLPISQGFIFFVMFANFYFKSYSKPIYKKIY